MERSAVRQRMIEGQIREAESRLARLTQELEQTRSTLRSLRARLAFVQQARIQIIERQEATE